MTYRELVYAILDLLKETSDDSFYSIEHFLFLASKMRAAILKLTYSNVKKEIPESNYLTICLDLEALPFTLEGCNGERNYHLRSKLKLPTILPIGNIKIYSNDYYQKEITYVSRERMRYVGYNKWLLDIIYASLGPGLYLYLKSRNELVIKEIRIVGIFEDDEYASLLKCDCDGAVSCDVLDRQFPLEEGLVTTLIEMAVKFLSGSIYKPADTTNDASDLLSELASFLRQNLKSPMQKQIEG